MTIRIYQDVDGVLNVQASTWGDSLSAEKASPHGGSFTIKWSPAMIGALNELDVEFVWLTTWCEEADKYIKPMMGIAHPTRVVGPLDGELVFPSMAWKHEALLADLAQNPGPFIWLDDETNAWHQAAAEAMGGIAPNIYYKTGITPQIMETIQEYISSHSS